MAQLWFKDGKTWVAFLLDADPIGLSTGRPPKVDSSEDMIGGDAIVIAADKHGSSHLSPMPAGNSEQHAGSSMSAVRYLAPRERRGEPCVKDTRQDAASKQERAPGMTGVSKKGNRGKQSPAQSGSLMTSMIAGRRVDSDVRTTAWSVFPDGEIVYAFLGSVIPENLVEAQWTDGISFHSDVVYVRTPKGVFQTRFRRLEGLQRVLPSRASMRVHRSIVVNTKWITEMDLPRRVRVRAGATFEYLNASRRNFVKLMRRLGLGRTDFS